MSWGYDMTDEEVMRKFMQDDSLIIDKTDHYFVAVGRIYAEIMKRIMALEEKMDAIFE